MGRVRAGDRLPSIREVAHRIGKNERTVKAAYEMLAAEGIVEIRGRSGVFAAQQELRGREVAEEKSRWLTSFVVDAWRRRIAVPGIAAEVERYTARRRVRCILVEPVHDAAVAFQHELIADWGFHVDVVPPERIARAQNADVFAATSFFAPAIHLSLEARQIPLVVLTTHAALREAIRQRVETGRLTVVAVDEHFVERIRASYAADHQERVHLVLASDREGIHGLNREEPILLTRAAREALGYSPAPLIFPHSPTLSLETARALAQVIVRLNSEAE